MQNFQDTVETPKRSFISAFSICMTVPLIDFRNCVVIENGTKFGKFLLRQIKIPENTY